MKKRFLAGLVCAVLVLLGGLSACASEAGVLEGMLLLTATWVPMPKAGDFTAVRFADEQEEEVLFSGIPGEWFENAEFVRYAAPDPSGWLNGIYIDSEANKVLLVEGGDRLNMVFLVDETEVTFGIGPGAQIAVLATEGGYALLAEETVALSPPQTEPIPAAYAALVE